MARETRSHARVACEGPSPTVKGGGLAYRSAGACPPRSLDLCGKRPQPRDTDVCCAARGMARDRPSPYGEGRRFFTVARGPVPRDLSTAAENVRSPETTDVCCAARGMARDRPSPYGETEAALHTVARGLSPAIVGRFMKPSLYPILYQKARKMSKEKNQLHFQKNCVIF